MRWSGGRYCGQPTTPSRMGAATARQRGPIAMERASILWVAPFKKAEKPMCDKCIEIDKRTERYRRISASISDQLTIDRIDALVEKLEAEKAALHPRESAGPHS